MRNESGGVMSACLIDYTVDIGGWAPWVQALGSIAAVVVAILISMRQSREGRIQSERQHEAAQKLADRQHSESLLLLKTQHDQAISREDRIFHRDMLAEIGPGYALLGGLIHVLDAAVNQVGIRQLGASAFMPMKFDFKYLEGVVKAIHEIAPESLKDYELVREMVQVKALAADAFCFISSFPNPGDIEDSAEQDRYTETVSTYSLKLLKSKVAFDKQIIFYNKKMFPKEES